MPERVQLRRAKGWRLPEGAVSVAYPTRWQNPHRKVRPRAQAVALYREHLGEHPELVDAVRRELAGKPLACWCPLDELCHADVLLEVANGGRPHGTRTLAADPMARGRARPHESPAAPLDLMDTTRARSDPEQAWTPP